MILLSQTERFGGRNRP